MSLNGNIETVTIPGVLQLLCSAYKTGILEVSNNFEKAKIFIKDGNIAYASTSDKGHRIGSLLKSKGLVTDENIKSCLLLATKNGKRIGKIMVELGYLTSRDLQDIIKHQVKEILCRLFTWNKGKFVYRDASIKIDKCHIQNTMQLILEVLRRLDEQKKSRALS